MEALTRLLDAIDATGRPAMEASHSATAHILSIASLEVSEAMGAIPVLTVCDDATDCGASAAWKRSRKHVE